MTCNDRLQPNIRCRLNQTAFCPCSSAAITAASFLAYTKVCCLGSGVSRLSEQHAPAERCEPSTLLKYTYPAGEVMTRLHSQDPDHEGYGRWVPRQVFVFEGMVCDGSPATAVCEDQTRSWRIPASPEGFAARGSGFSGQRGVRALPGPAADAIGPMPGARPRAPQDRNPTPVGRSPRKCLRGCAPEPDGHPTPRRRVVRGPTWREAAARITEPLHTSTRSRSPTGPSIALGYP